MQGDSRICSQSPPVQGRVRVGRVERVCNPEDWTFPANCLLWVSPTAWTPVWSDRRHHCQGREGDQRWQAQQRCILPTTCRCLECRAWHQRVHQAVYTIMSPPRRCNSVLESQRLLPGQSQPASVLHSCWLKDSEAWDLCEAHCVCGKSSNHGEVETSGSSPYHHQSPRWVSQSISSNPDRNAQIQA